MNGTGRKLMAAQDLAQERERMYSARKRVNKIALGLSLAAMAFGLVWLIWILWDTVVLALSKLLLVRLRRGEGTRG